MKIKKIGHCCLVIEITTPNGTVRLMTDPGGFTIGQKEERNIDAVLFTHEHGDHFHIPSLKAILENNPGVRIIANTAVGKLLTNEGITFEVLENGASAEVKGVKIGSKDELHALIYKQIPQVQNTGYFIFDTEHKTFFYPGDTFMLPEEKVDVLALPVAGPWMKISEAIEYTLAVKPKVAFPVHDAILAVRSMGTMWPQKFITEAGISFVIIEDGGEATF